jgi:hypothetical protein
MAYRIQIFLGDRKVVDLASNRPLSDTREEALDAMTMLNGDYALILDEAGQLIDRMKRSA